MSNKNTKIFNIIYKKASHLLNKITKKGESIICSLHTVEDISSNYLIIIDVIEYGGKSIKKGVSLISIFSSV